MKKMLMIIVLAIIGVSAFAENEILYYATEYISEVNGEKYVEMLAWYDNGERMLCMSNNYVPYMGYPEYYIVNESTDKFGIMKLYGVLVDGTGDENAYPRETFILDPHNNTLNGYPFDYLEKVK